MIDRRRLLLILAIAAPLTAAAALVNAGRVVPLPFKAPASTYTAIANSKVTLPVDCSGQPISTNAACDISQPTLATYADAYFHLGGDGTAVFRAPSNGSPTSPGGGTDFTRSELRYYCASCADTQNFTTAIGATINGTLRLHAVAANATLVFLGQVHAPADVYCYVYYLKSGGKVQGKQLSGPGGSNTLFTFASGVNLGDQIAYTIQLVPNGNTVMTVTINGGAPVSNTFTVTQANWTGIALFAKQGIYHDAPVTGNPVGDETRASFSQLSVTYP